MLKLKVNGKPMEMTAADDVVIVKMIDPLEQKQKGIIVPKTVKENKPMFQVVEIGAKVNEKTSLGIGEGDYVDFRAGNSPVSVKYNGIFYICANVEDIQYVLRNMENVN